MVRLKTSSLHHLALEDRFREVCAPEVQSDGVTDLFPVGGLRKRFGSIVGLRTSDSGQRHRQTERLQLAAKSN